MQRVLTMAYGLACYAIFFATFLYSIGFIGNLWVPKSIDSAPTTDLLTALVINAGLLAIFAVQHSLMARPFFKKAIARFVPPSVERSTYVLASSLALILLFAGWQPMGGVIWDFQADWLRIAMHVAYASGWLLVLYSTFAINHFDLFGLRQTWLAARGRPYEAPRFVQPFIYRLVRHPLYVGWLFVIWATPTMTVAHLVFAIATTLYILIGIQFEEADLAKAHPEYADYKRRVPMLVPRLGRSRVATEAATR